MKYLKGNILDSEAQALVNTVNTVGVMGKGIALQFKEHFPQNFKAYKKACKEGKVQVGKMFVFKETGLYDEKIIINFPTKEEWFKKSQYKFIDEGLKELAQVIEKLDIKSIAIPPLGCGNGGLNWERVKGLINEHLGHLEGVDILIYEPSNEFKQVLQGRTPAKDVQLTPARAMFLYLLLRYEKHGEYATLFTANKLAYLLQLMGEPLKLKFEPYLYGPYSPAVEKVLYALNGKYLKGLEQLNCKPFDMIKLDYEKIPELKEYIKKNLSFEQTDRLKKLFVLIQGFESALSLEVLASVAYELNKNPSLSETEMAEEIRNWNSRKKNLIDEEYVNIAYKHLKEYGNRLEFA